MESRKLWYVIPCGNEKLSHAAPAAELYTGQQFRHTLEKTQIAAGYDREAGFDAEIVIMSALHGLVRLDEVLEPYDCKLPRRKAPAPEYLAMLRRQAAELGITWDTAEVYALVGKDYYRALDEALFIGEDISLFDVYETCHGIGDQRRVNCHIAQPVPFIDPDAPWTPPTVDQVDAIEPAPLKVWIGADTNAFAWGESILVNYGRMRKLVKLPRATAPWALDCGINEIMSNGTHLTTPEQYAADVRRYVAEVGRLEWVGPQDWPGAARVLALTGLTVHEHQRLTIESVKTLRRLLGDLVDVLAVITGDTPEDYERHIEMYSAAGIDLTREKLVGVGALLGRPSGEVARIVRALHAAGVTRMHGFGLKTGSLALIGHLLASTDSTDWQREGRYDVGLCRHEGSRVRWETNCPEYAREWRARQQEIAARAAERVEAPAPALAEYVQESLFDLAA